jgi:hypothetical protein
MYVRFNFTQTIDSRLFRFLSADPAQEFNMAPKTDKPQNFPQVPGDREFMVELCKRTPDLITKLGIKSNPVTVRGSLDDVLAGWEDMKVCPGSFRLRDSFD